MQKGKLMKTVGQKHQAKIKRRARKNPIEAFFLGGFDLLTKPQQSRVMRQLEQKKTRK